MIYDYVEKIVLLQFIRHYKQLQHLIYVLVAFPVKVLKSINVSHLVHIKVLMGFFQNVS